MNILAYGEDSLTYWALKNKISLILDELKDDSEISNCTAYFRPSFGRSGGQDSSQFGEFDFIILSEKAVYLGESKWDNSSEVKGSVLELREEQKDRHTIFKSYITNWCKYDNLDWDSFYKKMNGRITGENGKVDKPIAPEDSLLARNLTSVLKNIKDYLGSDVKIQNIVLYLSNGNSKVKLDGSLANDFQLINIDYSSSTEGSYIKL